MKTKLLIVFAFIFSLFFSVAGADVAKAVSTTGHATPGGSGINPDIFPDRPSFVWRFVTAYQSAVANNDEHGHAVGEPFEAYGLSFSHKFVYTPDIEKISWLGDATYHTHLILPMTFAEMSAGGAPYKNSLGIGDPTFFPLDLTWRFGKLQLAYSSGAFLPIGHHFKYNPTTLGRNFWTWVNIGGATWIDDNWSAGLLVRYEKHYTQRHTNFRNGDDLSFEWSISRKLNPNWEIGLVGYDWIQVGDDKGVDEFGRSADLYRHDQVHGAGFEVQYTNIEKGYQLGLRAVRDYKAEGRMETWHIAFTTTFLFF